MIASRVHLPSSHDLVAQSRLLQIELDQSDQTCLVRCLVLCMLMEKVTWKTLELHKMSWYQGCAVIGWQIVICLKSERGEIQAQIQCINYLFHSVTVVWSSCFFLVLYIEATIKMTYCSFLSYKINRSSDYHFPLVIYNNMPPKGGISLSFWKIQDTRVQFCSCHTKGKKEPLGQSQRRQQEEVLI